MIWSSSVHLWFSWLFVLQLNVVFLSLSGVPTGFFSISSSDFHLHFLSPLFTPRCSVHQRWDIQIREVIAVGWMTVVRFQTGAGIFALATTMSKTPIWHFHSPVQWVSRVKRLECAGDHVSSCAEVRNICSITVLCHMSSWDELGKLWYFDGRLLDWFLVCLQQRHTWICLLYYICVFHCL